MSERSDKKLSKRQAMRLERAKKDRQRRLITISAVVVVAIVLVALFALPTIQSLNAPVGEFTEITPKEWPESANGLAMGDPNAPVTIEVFEDFQCVACRNYSESIEPRVISEIVESGQVYYVFHNYPFLDDQSAIKDSDNAAMGAMCAAEQNRFWDYKSLLFANYGFGPGGFSEKRLVAFAESLALDSDEFNSCLKENRYQDEINQDLAEGGARGVTGTPSVFVNGVNIKPGFVPSFDEIQTAVNTALEGS